MRVVGKPEVIQLDEKSPMLRLAGNGDLGSIGSGRIVGHSDKASLARSEEAVVYIRRFEKQLRCSRQG